MTYSRGRHSIAIERIEGFGKNPGLWVGVENQSVKVASFRNEECANKFQEWLEYLIFGEEVQHGENEPE